MSSSTYKCCQSKNCACVYFKNVCIRYQSLWWWVDETIAYYGFPNSRKFRNPVGECAHTWDYTDTYYASECEYPPSFTSILCEFPRPHDHDYVAETSGINIQTPTKEPNATVKLILCPSGHVTHQFLSCDGRSACWMADVRSAAVCKAPVDPVPPSFPCSDGVDRVPYTLLCDHRPDCWDESDESFCQFPPCDVFLELHCGNGQVISQSI